MAVLSEKPFYLSSTLWINFIGIVAVVLDLVLKLNLIKDLDIVAIIIATLNILNRFRLTKPSDATKLTLT